MRLLKSTATAIDIIKLNVLKFKRYKYLTKYKIIITFTINYIVIKYILLHETPLFF